MDLIESNAKLRSFLTPGEKLLCSRLGVVESQVLDALDDENSKISLRLRKHAWVNAGIFPPLVSQLGAFAEKYREAILNTDLFAVWPVELQIAHDNLIRRYGFRKPQVEMSALDIFTCSSLIQPEDIWISKLSGRKVLVVHPFAGSFQLQYSKLSELHRIPLMPNFDAIFTAPPMTQGTSLFSGNYISNLTEYLDELDGITSRDVIDYALIAAGAYGLPIANFLKEKSITTIYVGGTLQLFFGVAGARWNNRSDLQLYRTSLWLDKPLESPPRGAKLIEGKTYW